MEETVSKPIDPLVSILVITYNQEAYIANTLESLLNQDCDFPYEILVGEDCSTDGTRAICETYARQYPGRIRLIANPTNLGLMPNYLNLIRQAKGHYLSDCGGDDYWVAPDRLRRQVALLESHPEVTMVVGNWRLLHEADGSLSLNQMQLTADLYEPHRCGPQAVADYLNRRYLPFVVLSTACFRTAQVNTLLATYPALFEGPDAACEDLPLTLMLLAQGPFYVQKDEVLVYRLLPKSVSHDHSAYALQKGFANRAFWQAWSIISLLGLDAKAVRPYIKRQWDDMVHAAFITADQEWMRAQTKRLKTAGLTLPFKAALKATILNCKPLYHAVSWLLHRFSSTNVSPEPSCQR